MSKRHKSTLLRIHGGINSQKTQDIIENVVKIYNTGKEDSIDISLDEVSATDFHTIAKLVTTLKSIDVKKKVSAISNVSIAALSLLSMASAGRRSIPEYLEIDFRIPEIDAGLDEEQLNKLYLQYAQMMKSIQNDSFTETNLIDYMKTRKRITGQMAKSLGIIGSPRGKGSKTGTLLSPTQVNVPEKEIDSDIQQGKEVTV